MSAITPENFTHGIAAAPAQIESRPTLVKGGHSYRRITDLILQIIDGSTPKWWFIAFGISSLVASMCVAMILYLMATGVGVWGLNNGVYWAWDITNFVFWVGIGHAGTLISAILFLLRQKWRTSINRAAEAMTLFAVVCAGIFPGIHIGRIWYAWMLAPVPNNFAMWPNFRSALLWDVFAVSTYATVSLLFWYVGLIPDLATIRDRTTSRIKQIAYGFFALGWRGTNRQWRNYEMAYLLLAGLSTPLVLSVHTVVSFDFATSVIPGWHSTIFPPYFVAGAVFSGFAMVITLIVPARALFKQLQDLITVRHLENICKVILATGCMVGYAYGMEFFIAWYGANPYEKFVFINRATGPYAWAYWIMVSCNVITPQLFWFKKIRTSPWLMFVLAAFVNVGMWFERFVIIVTSLHRDPLPASWTYFSPTWVDILTFVGSFGVFFTLFLLFVRFVPMVAIAEVKGVMEEKQGTRGHGHRPDAAEIVPGAPAAGAIGTPAEPAQDQPWGMVATFDGPHDLVDAARKVREAGYKKFDVHTPFPVHGMDDAMGLGRSKVGWIVLGGGIIGLATAIGMQVFAAAIDYPLMTGGKPFNSWQAWVPVCFELMVLFAAFAAVIGMIAVNGLPQWYHPTLKHRSTMDSTDDRFTLVIESGDPAFHAEKTREFLGAIGGKSIAVLEA